MSSLLCLIFETQEGPNQLDEFYFQKDKRVGAGKLPLSPSHGVFILDSSVIMTLSFQHRGLYDLTVFADS